MLQKRSSINYDNREKLVLNHTSGRTPFLSRFKMMKEKSEIGLFKVTRVSKRKGNRFVNKEAEAEYNKMVNMLKEATEKGEQVSESVIGKEILGHKSGYIKGMGHGLQVVRGNISSITAGIDINKKLFELDNANEKLEILTTAYEEQKSTMEKLKSEMLKMQKMMEKLPRVSELCTEHVDVVDGQAQEI